jgi:hypothetical protein
MNTNFNNNNNNSSRMTENAGGFNSGVESTGAYSNREVPRGQTENMAGGFESRENVGARDGLNARDNVNTHSGMNSHSGMNTHSGLNSQSGMNTHSGLNSQSGINTHSGTNSHSGINTHSGLNSRDGLNTQENMMTGSSGRTEGLSGHHQSSTASGLNTGLNNSTSTSTSNNTLNSTSNSNVNSSGRHPRTSVSNLPSGLSAASGTGPGPIGSSTKPSHMSHNKSGISGIRDPRDAPTNSVDVGPPDAARQPPSVMRQHLGAPEIEHDYPEDSTARRHSVSHQEREILG